MKKTLVNRAAGRSRGGKRKCPAVPRGSTPPPATIPAVVYEKFARMAQWRLGIWRLEREDEDGCFCLYNLRDGHSPSFDDAGLQQLAELLRNVVVKL